MLRWECYERNLSVNWTLAVLGSNFLLLRLTSFNIEVRSNGSNSECWDYLEVSFDNFRHVLTAL